MFFRKKYVIVILDCDYPEFLGVSVPSLAKMKNIYLVVRGENITARDVCKFGYRGKLCINGDIAKIKSDWTIFMRAGDILKNIDIPPVSDVHCAILQNAEVLTDGRVMRPNRDIYGTAFRTDFVLKNMENGINIQDANPIYMDNVNYIKARI